MKEVYSNVWIKGGGALKEHYMLAPLCNLLHFVNEDGSSDQALIYSPHTLVLHKHNQVIQSVSFNWYPPKNHKSKFFGK